jgi:2-dehydropantoate 2-reductase
MKIAIVGTGAMGSVYAGLLASAGNEVWAVDRDAAHVRAIEEHGLRVEGASGDRVARLRAVADPAEIGQAELVVIATKAIDVEDAARVARPLVGPDTVVLPIQNGLGSADRVASILGEKAVALGVVGGFGASIVAPGHVHHHGLELVRMGERKGVATDRIERVAEVWRLAGFTVKTYDDPGRLVWEKLIFNVAFSGTCALTGGTIGEVMGDASGWSVASRCAAEAFAVAVALDVAVDIDDPVRYVREFGSTIPGARPSMLLDLLAGRRCEIDFINGAIGPLARTLGLSAPTNDTVTRLVKARETVIIGAAAAA